MNTTRIKAPGRTVEEVFNSLIHPCGVDNSKHSIIHVRTKETFFRDIEDMFPRCV